MMLANIWLSAQKSALESDGGIGMVHLITVTNIEAPQTRHVQHVQKFSEMIIQLFEGP